MSARAFVFVAALAIAGASHAGLGGSVWTIDSVRAQRNEEVVVAVQFAGDGQAVDASFEVQINPMYLTPLSAVGANGGDCAVLPPVALFADTVRVLAPPYDGQPLDTAPTTLCRITYRVESAPPQNVALSDGVPLCVRDDGSSGTCFGASGNVLVENLVAEPDIGGSLAIVGDAGATNAMRTLTVTNTSTSSPYMLGMCDLLPPSSGITVSPQDSSVMPAASLDLVLDCTLPPAGTTIAATLDCITDDPALDSFRYAVTCTRQAASQAGGPTPQDPIESPDTDAGDLFGTSVALTDAGDTDLVVVGAPNGGDGGGQVFVYERVPGDPFSQKSLTASTRPLAILRPRAKSIGDKFGQSVAVSTDGTLIAVGAPEGGAGAVMVYARPPTGWQDPTGLAPVSITAPSPQAGVVASGFGASLAFAPDNTLVIGANKSDVAGATDAGAAYLFTIGGGGAVQLGAPMTPSAPQANGRFGSSLGAATSFVAIGAPGEGSDTGALYAFQTSGAGAGPGARSTRAGGAIGDKWGTSVSVAGGVVVVGAPDANTVAGTDSGLATVMQRGAGTSLTERTTLLPADGAGQGTGASVATNGEVVILGAPLADIDSDVDRGRAYAFELDASVTSSRPDVTIDGLGGDAGDAFAAAVAIGRRLLLAGAPANDDEIAQGGAQVDAGRVDPFLLDGVYRDGFE